MPEGPVPLKIKLLVVETGKNDHTDFEPEGILGRLGVLFGATSGWISTINVIRGAFEHEIVFTHRTITVPTISPKAAAKCLGEVRSLADGLYNPRSSFSLEAVSNGIKNIRYMPCTSNQSGPQKHFNRQFVLFALQYTVGDVFFEDMDANAQCFLQRNPQKWFLGPLQAGVFLSDFLDIFDKLATSLPLEAVLTQGQPSDLSKEAILLQVLKYGAKYAPALRAACTVGIGDLDKDIIRRKFVEADAAVKTAIDNACSKLQELRYLDDDKFDDSVQEIQRELTQSIKASQPARGIATKESDRNVGNFVKCVGGGLVITAVGSGILLYGPAVGGFLAIEYAGILQLVVEGLGFGGIVAGTSLASLGAVINGIKAYNSYNYIKGLDDIHVRSFDIYSFLALATLRRTGQLDDDDERFIKFALNYAEIFEGADVIGQWGDPEFIRKYADQTSGHLRQKLEEFKKLSVI